MDLSNVTVKKKKQRQLFFFKNLVRIGIFAAALLTSTSAFADEIENEENTTTAPVVNVEESPPLETGEVNDPEVEVGIPVVEENALESEKILSNDGESTLEEEGLPTNEVNTPKGEENLPTDGKDPLEPKEGLPTDEKTASESGKDSPTKEVSASEPKEGSLAKEVKPAIEDPNEASPDDSSSKKEDFKDPIQDVSTIIPENDTFIETIPIEETQKQNEDRMVKTEDEPPQKTKIKEEVESQIKVLIRAKADAEIETEREQQKQIFMKNVSTAQIKMNKMLKDWSTAKKQLVIVNKMAKAIKVINGKPNLEQVAITIGQYQAIANELAVAKRDRDLVNVVSGALDILIEKKVEPGIIVGFVKETIHTSKDVSLLLNSLEKKHLFVFDLVQYEIELKQREVFFKKVEGNSRLPLFKIASLHFGGLGLY